jgi:hypothetical protein
MQPQQQPTQHPSTTAYANVPNMHQQQQSPAAVYSQVNVAPTIQQGMQSNYQQQPNAQIHDSSAAKTDALSINPTA